MVARWELGAADPEVSQAAVRALQSTGPTAAEQALATALEAEPPLARVAAHALRALGGDVARRNADSLSSVLEEEAGLVDDYDLW